MDIFVSNNGDLAFGDFNAGPPYRSGLRENSGKDGATPIGRFPLRRGFFGRTGFRTVIAIILSTDIAGHGWCDDKSAGPQSIDKTPFSGSAEYLWRNDRRYDLIVVLGHNDDPPIPVGKRRFHVVPRHTPTEGCVAMAYDLMTLRKGFHGNADNNRRAC